MLESKRKDLSVIIPTHNEANVIFQMVSETARVLEASFADYEIVVVNDGSTDSTADEIERAASNFKNVLVLNIPENIGKGNALMRGFWESSGDVVCFIDADLDLHPSHITSFLSLMKENNADCVIGSKRHPLSKLDYPFHRKIFSSIYYMFTRVLFNLPVKDTQTGIKLFKRELLEKTFPRILCKQYAMDLELLAVAHRLGFSILEAPINLTFQGKFGRIKWSDIRNIIIDTLAVFYRTYFLKYYDSPMLPPSKHEPSASIIIPTKSIDRYALECLSKCSHLDYSNFDIWLVPDENTQLNTKIEHIQNLHIEPSGKVGPSAKRNIAVRKSNSEILGFIDSDAWPDALWLKNAASYFKDRKVAAVCGPALTPPEDSIRQRAGGLVYTSSLVSANTTFRYAPRAMREVDDYPSCNLLVRRSELDSQCAFPEEFWPGEDTVLCLKLTKEKGKKILYVPNVTVFHHRRPLFIPHLRQVFSYARHRGFFVKKFPETSRKLKYFVPSIFVIWLVIGLALSFVFKPLLYAFLGVLGFYLLMCAFSSVKSLEPLVNLYIFPGIILTNITYGIGFILGLLSRRMSDS